MGINNSFAILGVPKIFIKDKHVHTHTHMRNVYAYQDRIRTPLLRYDHLALVFLPSDIYALASVNKQMMTCDQK